MKICRLWRFYILRRLMLSIYKHTLSKCPGGHPILHWKFKDLISENFIRLNSKVSVKKYKKNCYLPRPLDFLPESYAKFKFKNTEIPWNKIQNFSQNLKHKGSISPYNFDGQLPNILFTNLCLYVGSSELLLGPNSKVKEKCITS